VLLEIKLGLVSAPANFNMIGNPDLLECSQQQVNVVLRVLHHQIVPCAATGMKLDSLGITCEMGCTPQTRNSVLRNAVPVMVGRN